MHFQISHTEKEKLESISERLRRLKKANAYLEHVDNKVTSKNLQLNLSRILVQLILNATYINKSKQKFLNVVRKFNKDNNTNLKFEDFEKRSWIRTLFNEVLIPSHLSDYLWKVNYSREEKKPIDVPNKYKDLIECLILYHQTYFDRLPIISKAKVSKILSQYAQKQITIDTLVKEEILKETSTTSFEYRIDNDYSRYLKVEIVSLLWLEIKGKEISLNKIEEFLKFLHRSNIWVEDLKRFLQYEDLKQINAYIISLINAEQDLIKSDLEFQKAWWDSGRTREMKIELETPKFKFNYTNPYEFLESIKRSKDLYYDIFDYQSTRSVYLMLLRFIINNDTSKDIPFLSIISLLKDASRPYILLTIYKSIPKEYPYLLPYLLVDKQLAPLAFKLADKIGVDDIILSDRSDHQTKLEEIYKTRDSIWFEMFDVIIDRVASNRLSVKEDGELLSRILIDLVKQVFITNRYNQYSYLLHGFHRKRYERVLEKLKTARIDYTIVYPKPIIRPRLILTLLPEMVVQIQNKLKEKQLFRNRFLSLKLNVLDLSIEMLRISSSYIHEHEFSEEKHNEILKSNKELLHSIFTYLIDYYTRKEVEITDVLTNKKVNKPAKRGVNEFGFEIIDWAYLFLKFEEEGLLEELNKKFLVHLSFDSQLSKYDDQNREQIEKLNLYLKSLMLAFASTQKEKERYMAEGIQVDSVLAKLELWIKEYALKYSKDKLSEERMNVFNETLNRSSSGIYYVQLIKLLYECLNHLERNKTTNFINKFFEKSNDVENILKAINVLDSSKHKDILSEKIKKFNVNKFLKNHSSIELEGVLVEATNSTQHWNIASPILLSLQNQLSVSKHHDEDRDFLLFEVELILAFKEKSLSNIVAVKTPNNVYHSNRRHNYESIKKFFVAIHQLYNNENFDQAINGLSSLVSEHPKNVKYAFHLYRAKTLKAIKLDINELHQANLEWEDFKKELADNQQRELLEYKELESGNKTHLYVATDDFIRFAQMVNALSDRYLYDEELIPVIYGYYIKKDLIELAYDYLNNSKMYREKNGLELPEVLSKLMDNHFSTEILHKIRMNLNSLSSQRSEDIPKVLPVNLNGRSKLNEFILKELIQSSGIMVEKIEAIRDIKSENRFNDLFIATLRLRFPIWGWNITDQPRTGSTLVTTTQSGKKKGGKDAGSADLVIKSAGNSIALIEGLVLRDTSYTKTHILKCREYHRQLTHFFIVVYAKDKDKSFDAEFERYKNQLLEINYPKDFALIKDKSFQLMNPSFENVEHLKIFKTFHSSEEITIHHILINLIKKTK